MKRLTLALIAVVCLLGARAQAQSCSATCSNVTTPKEPVILVHGRNDTSSRWDTLVSNWSTRGYKEGVNLFRLDMTSFCGANDFCSMLPAYSGATVNESYAKCLKAFIDQKVPCTSSGCPAVDIVAHSQGTILTLYYSRFLADRVVDDIVIMGSPHNGITNCTLVSSCPGVNPEDCPNSQFLEKLNGVLPYGDGSNTETPNATALGPIHYAAVASSGDNVVPPWCGSYFILSPNTLNGGNLNCKTPNYTIDPNSTSCFLSNVLHLNEPTNTSAINFAYCEVNKD